MSELAKLITRVRKGIEKNAGFIKIIKHPYLLLVALQELYDVVGNNRVKDAVATQIISLILEKNRSMKSGKTKEENFMLNTMLCGLPGVGKTEIGKKLAKIYYALGFINGAKNPSNMSVMENVKDFVKNSSGDPNPDENTVFFIALIFFGMIMLYMFYMAWSMYKVVGAMWLGIFFVGFIAIATLSALWVAYSNNSTTSKQDKNIEHSVKDVEGNEIKIPKTLIPSEDQIIRVVSRDDFIDKYLGGTDKKTKALLQSSLGKVLFVDEAYSLVSGFQDMYGNEALTTLNLFMSQHPNEIIVIFAGYKDKMEDIFQVQPGLRRRFMWHFECEKYNGKELFEIFKQQANKRGWGIGDESVVLKLFEQNLKAFPAFGGDTERLINYSKNEYARDYLDNDNMAEDILLPRHIAKGILILRENTPEDKGVSTDAMANIMKLLSGKQKEPEKKKVESEEESAFQSREFRESSDFSKDKVSDSDVISAVNNSRALFA